ncbi:hypothetical protein XM38_025570 [Halomicronema hongdechloris C2206]|uniref:Calcineurin-like phosphoesterase domain-containing protein n=1 Tax=Halomicronema hongdechloris C2206 TaxID=1641165 RepID=A0A1Z3HMR6_9CYAN|nr:metallophosphoesterase [Halomicronema hongdechloris]ASC71604.1 hypothetical protein XM38_025570 [Halomicronema hongdechloris C2206]
MVSILDPAISTKIRKMQGRVRWQHPLIQRAHIDQTRLQIEDTSPAQEAFSFLVIGDSGSGPHPDHHPQRRIARRMVPHLEDCSFLLHTGDVVYQVGSSEQYPANFIAPYRDWLVGGEQPQHIAYDAMVFRHPFLPVLGNHDYYNLPALYGWLIRASKPLRRWLGNLEPNVGWHGSYDGDAFARAFLDYLKGVPAAQLPQHLQTHYTVPTDTGYCLRYRPGQFTRLPNRYYQFRHGDIDFFALDSSTFNAPAPSASEDYRRQLQRRRQAVHHQRQQVLEEAAQLHRQGETVAERWDDLQAKLEQFDEVLLDLEKQLPPPDASPPQALHVDWQQLEWLAQRLIASWRTPTVRGRVLYFHHPPYVSEVTKWHQGQTLAVRQHLRWVLDRVAVAVSPSPSGQPLVDLVLCGHAHCFEYLRTVETGHGDAHLNWIVCGGSGLSLRRQRPEGADLYEGNHLVAKSQLFVGLTGHRSERRRPYSFLRIDVQPGHPPKFVVRPYISERYHQQWQDYGLAQLVL